MHSAVHTLNVTQEFLCNVFTGLNPEAENDSVSYETITIYVGRLAGSMCSPLHC